MYKKKNEKTYFWASSLTEKLGLAIFADRESAYIAMQCPFK